ncbi:MAG: hypothetical protein J2P41_18480 [Blastocatellia bacterium]|nr:hypothetical protein [Blastocatellia bacterium]
MDATFNIKPTNSLSFISELRRRNPLLFGLGVAHLVLFCLMLLISPFDHRTVMGINPWIKPMKFAISIAIYALTMAWILGELPMRDVAKRWISWILAGTLVIEIVLITMQAARGVTSHFNNATLFDSAVFATMGTAIFLNIVAAAYVAVQFWRSDIRIPAPYLWGIRLGLIIFVLASLEGFAMVSHGAHSVGVADGGAGLPLLNWSTRGGDLRPAHFFGIHSLQVLPIIGALLSSKGMKLNSVRLVQAIGIIYGITALLLFLWALSGRPLVSLG